MNLQTSTSPLVLEDRIFKNALLLCLAGILFLLIYDGLITQDRYSLVTEVVLIVFIIINYRITILGKSSPSHHFVFSMILLLFMDFGWITGGGISMLMGTIMFICAQIILVINDVKNYRLIFIIFFINLAVLFSMEYFYHFNLLPEYSENKSTLVREYLILHLLIFFGGYFTVFLKLNYSKEQEKLNKANELLMEQALEISNQNDQLQHSKYELDQMVDELEDQRKELVDIKENLEEKVRERTDDLLNLNKKLLKQNQQLEQYTYITSHNLRAPIARIKGLLSLLPKDVVQDPMTNETLQRLASSTDSMEKVFEDLSTILRIEKGIQHPWQEVDVCELLQDIIESLKSSIEEKEIRVDIPAPEGV